MIKFHALGIALGLSALTAGCAEIHAMYDYTKNAATAENAADLVCGMSEDSIRTALQLTGQPAESAFVVSRVLNIGCDTFNPVSAQSDPEIQNLYCSRTEGLEFGGDWEFARGRVCKGA